MKRIIRNTVVAFAGVAIVAGVSLPAYAASTPPPKTTRTLAEIQASATTHTSDRITALHTAVQNVIADKHLSNSDSAAILTTLNGDLSGLKALAATIATDTTVAQAASDYKRVFTEYRVYTVALPQARYAAAADQLMGTTIPKLIAMQEKLSAVLSRRDGAKSTLALQADLTDMSDQIAAAQKQLSGLFSAALEVTPASYNSNHSVLASVKASLTSSHTAVKKARADAQTVITAVRLARKA